MSRTGRPRAISAFPGARRRSGRRLPDRRTTYRAARRALRARARVAELVVDQLGDARSVVPVVDPRARTTRPSGPDRPACTKPVMEQQHVVVHRGDRMGVHAPLRERQTAGDDRAPKRHARAARERSPSSWESVRGGARGTLDPRGMGHHQTLARLSRRLAEDQHSPSRVAHPLVESAECRAMAGSGAAP